MWGTPNYGEYTEGNMKLIVSSGVARWRYPVRTGEHCEYALINIEKNKLYIEIIGFKNIITRG